jgi:putative mycofactocin binding protein MftB
MVDSFDPSIAWRLSPDASLRAEEFGALAYNHVNRRLVFLKSSALAALVGRLGDFASADDALDAMVDARSRARYLVALGSLADSGVIRGR